MSVSQEHLKQTYKTEIAKQYPLLSRRQRRELMREMARDMRKILKENA